MSGLLSNHPLAELILEISDAHLSGVLRLSRGRAKGAIYFDDGQTTGALTNIRAYRMVEALRRNGTIASEKLDVIVKPEMPDDAAGAALVAAGLISNDDLTRLRERLAFEVLRQLLQWEDGEWVFDARVRVGETQRVRLETSHLLLENARRLAPAFAPKSFRDADEKLSPTVAENVGGAGDGLQLQPAEAFVMSRFDTPLKVGEIVAISGLPEQETREAIYVLMLGGLLRRERLARVLPNRPTTPAKAATAGARQPVDSMATSDGTTKPGEDAGQYASETPTPDTAASPKDQKEELAELFARVEGGSHYEVLGVSRLAKPDEIKRAYYSLAKRFHPDRFQRNADEVERQRIELTFAKIAQAYDLLKDSALRASYDMKLSAIQKKSAGAAPSARREEPARESAGTADAKQPKAHAPSASSAASGVDPLRRAEELFQAGLAALKQNNFAVATKSFSSAVLLAPQQARYRAYFGLLLAREKATRRQAEAELQAAIALDTRNASYRVMLAELYRDVGLRRRAESELKHALSIDRTNIAALRLLDELRKGG